MADKKEDRILPRILGGRGPLGLKIPLPWEGSPIDVLKGLTDGVKELDTKIREVDDAMVAADNAIATADKVFTRRKPGRTRAEEPEPRPEPRPPKAGSALTPGTEDWQQVSFKGQTSLDYCIECLKSKHFPKARGLLKEAMSFSQEEGKLSKEGYVRVMGAIEELETAHADIDTADFEAGRQIQDEMRRIRKEVAWKNGLLDGPGADLKGLQEMIDAMDGLIEMTEKAAKAPGVLCKDCKKAVTATCKKLKSPFREKCVELSTRMVNHSLSESKRDAAEKHLEELKPGLVDKFYKNLYGR